MDKKQAQAIIKGTFETSFDKNRFIGFVKNLLNNIEEAPFTYRGNYIPDAYEQYINSLERIGKYNESEHKIDVLIVKLKKETSIERARTMQRNFIAWYLNGSRGDVLKDAALVAFVSPNEEDWRFSLVKMDYRFEEGKGGRLKVKEEFTPARRWSFLVGANEKSHTAQRQLVDIVADDENNPTLALLENAFNIETVTKEFFEEYRKLFLCVKETLDDVVGKDRKIKTDFETKGVNTVDFSKKLLGQIVFLYFLQKKGWFGVKRDGDWGTGPKNFLRELFEEKHGMYKNFFNDILEPLFYEALARERDDDFYSRFNCKIPFLNGGLFDPIGNYDWVHTDILLPNELFSNTRRTKEGDIGDGILDIFDRYNFTVKEDEPLEKEVAIDPELLGKAYEKFNAIRPDNYAEYEKALKSGQSGAESKFNKQYGVYYTPREIVHYICQQSLINYLTIKLEGKVIKEDIETLIKYGEQVSENEATVEAKGRETSTYFYKLSESIRQNAKLVDEKLTNIKVCDPAIGSGAFPVGMMSEIVKVRNVLSVYIKDSNRMPYRFKRECIEKSLYGVDIDAGAVEIAKLRLWLSLVVDEEDIKQIKPLPNLDYKIVCGDSLLGVEKDLLNLHLFNELERLKPLLFDETSPKKKQEYKKQIDEIINQITKGHKEFDFEVYFSEVFHEKKGFDVVISNPPYIFSREKLTAHDKAIYKENYKLTQFKINLYILFIEQAFNLLSNAGVMAYIVPNNWLTLATNSDLRYFLLTKTFEIKIILNYDKVFENADVDTCILIFRKKGLPQINSYQWDKRGIELLRSQAAAYYLHKNNYILGDIASKSSRGFEICDKINKQSGILSDFAEVKNGVQAYTVGEGNPKQTREMKERRVYHSKIQKDNAWIKYLDGVDVMRYKVGWSGELIKYGENLSRPREPYLFEGERLLVRQIPTQPPYCINCCYTNEHTINDNNSMIIKIKDKNLQLKYILGLLNSKLISFWFLQTFGKLQRKIFPQFKVKELRTFPIRKIDPDKQKSVVFLVDKILSLISTSDYSKDSKKQIKIQEYERQIDQTVYKLYDLTEEEIKIVEGA